MSVSAAHIALMGATHAPVHNSSGKSCAASSPAVTAPGVGMTNEQGLILLAVVAVIVICVLIAAYKEI
jgi:hypothetical protein